MGHELRSWRECLCICPPFDRLRLAFLSSPHHLPLLLLSIGSAPSALPPPQQQQLQLTDVRSRNQSAQCRWLSPLCRCGCVRCVLWSLGGASLSGCGRTCWRCAWPSSSAPCPSSSSHTSPHDDDQSHVTPHTPPAPPHPSPPPPSPLPLLPLRAPPPASPGPFSCTRRPPCQSPSSLLTPSALHRAAVRGHQRGEMGEGEEREEEERKGTTRCAAAVNRRSSVTATPAPVSALPSAQRFPQTSTRRLAAMAPPSPRAPPSCLPLPPASLRPVYTGEVRWALSALFPPLHCGRGALPQPLPLLPPVHLPLRPRAGPSHGVPRPAPLLRLSDAAGLADAHQSRRGPHPLLPSLVQGGRVRQLRHERQRQQRPRLPPPHSCPLLLHLRLPLPHQPVIRDLVTDQTLFFSHYVSTRPYLQPAFRQPSRPDFPYRSEYRQSPAERALLDGSYECILCACCSTACPE